MNVGVTILWVWLVATLFGAWCGWGLTLWLLPQPLRPFRWLLTVPLGYALAIWVGFNAVHAGLSLRQTLWPLLGLTLALNALAWRFRRDPADAASRMQRLRHLYRMPLPSIIAVAAIIGVLPLLSYGISTIIGGGWDGESYLALALHLQDHALATIGQAASSPLRDHVLNPPIIGLSLGMSVFHGWVALLSGQSALTVFAPLLAWLRALGFVLVYVWLRSAMGLRRSAAAWGTALGAAGALLLWITYFNFGMQLGAWPLIPLVLAVSVAAVEDVQQRGWAAGAGVLLAALAWASLTFTYYPALTVAVPMGLGLALALLIQAPPQRRGRTLAALVLLSGGTVPLTTWAISDYINGFAFRYANALTTLGLFHFIPLSDVLGWTAYHLQEPPPLAAWSIALSLGALLLGALALWRGPQRLRWTLALLGALVYLLWVRWGRAYPYAYIKGAAYVHFALMGWLAAGWQAAQGLARRWLRLGASALIGISLLVAAYAQSGVVRDHWGRSRLGLEAAAALDQAARDLPPSAPIYIATSPAWNGPQMSTIAAALYPRPLWGHVFSAYSNLDVTPSGQPPAYLLLSDQQTPAALNLPAASLVWSQGGLSLWQVDPLLRFWQPGRQPAASINALRQTPSGLAALGWGGPLRTFDQQHPLTFQLNADQSALLATLHVAASQPTTLELHTDQTARLAIPAGLSAITVPLHSASLELRADQSTALVDIEARSLPPIAESAAAFVINPEWYVWQPSMALDGQQLQLTIKAANPNQRALRGELTLSADHFGSASTSTALISMPITGAATYTLDLATLQLASPDPAHILAQPAAALEPDSYWLGLTLLDGAERIQTVPLGSVTLGAQPAWSPSAVSIETARLGPSATPELPGDLSVGPDLLLSQLGLATRTLAPGGSATLDLVWRSLSAPGPAQVSVQVLDASNHKWAQWDGPAGGWLAGLWPADVSVRQAVPLSLDPATPPGEYRLLLTVYDPVTTLPLLINGQSSLELGSISVP